MVKYEDLRANTADEMAHILVWRHRDPPRCGSTRSRPKLSFEALPLEARGPGKFARAATPGLWRERFSDEEQALLPSMLGPP